MKIINPTYNYQVGDIKKIPIIISDKHFNKVLDYVTKLVNIYRTDWNSHEYAWNFKLPPILNNENSLYSSFQSWHTQMLTQFLYIHTREEGLNNLLTNIYNLDQEFNPNVPFREITILQDEINLNKLEEAEKEYRKTGELTHLPIKEDIVMSQLLSYMIGCMMGRYSLDKPGLIMANQGESLNEAMEKHEIQEQSFPIDEDGIVSFNGSNSYFADDASHRVKEFLIAVWGEKTLTENINFLNECLGVDYEKWLVEKFWEFHCRMYKKTPIYWMFASNPKKPQRAAFKVLAYMHRMNKFTVQNIRNKYLHPYIQWLRDELDNLEKNKDNLDKEQLKRMEKLDEDKKECIQYEYVRKKLANEQIEFDLDDGVKHNIAKFEGAVAEIK